VANGLVFSPLCNWVFDFYRRHAVLARISCGSVFVRLSVTSQYYRGLHRNHCTTRSCFWHTCRLILDCVLTYGFFQNMGIAQLCPKLWITTVVHRCQQSTDDSRLFVVLGDQLCVPPNGPGAMQRVARLRLRQLRLASRSCIICRALSDDCSSWKIR